MSWLIPVLVHLLISQVNLTIISPYLHFRESILSSKRREGAKQTNMSSSKLTLFNTSSNQPSTPIRPSLLVPRIGPGIRAPNIDRPRRPSPRAQFPAQAPMLGARVQRPRVLNLQQPPAPPAREVGCRGQGRVSHLWCGFHSHHGSQYTRRAGQVQRGPRIVHWVTFLCPSIIHSSTMAAPHRSFLLKWLGF